MTIVLVILAVLILLAVLFLIFHVSKLSKAHRELMTDYYSALTNRFLNLNYDVNKQANTIITAINDTRTDVVRLTNKVDEGLTHCGNQTKDLKDTIVNLDSHLDARLTSPIDKINDTHNRIKTLGKNAASADDLRAVIADVVSAIATEAVDSICQKCAPKPKTTKKVTKEPVDEGTR